MIVPVAEPEDEGWGMMPSTPRAEGPNTKRSAGKSSGRLWEVDAARGVAILMMALYHTMYDLDTFGGYPVSSTSGFWRFFADATAFSFLFLVGVSLAISHARARARRPEGSLFSKYLLRGLFVLGWGMALTVVSLALGMGVIAFGILHLIGVSIILAYPFLNLRLPNLLLGLFIVAVGMYLQGLDLVSESPWLLPFGVVPEGWIMPDYRPLLPWFGVVLIGLFAGNVLYGGGKAPFGRVKGPLIAEPLGALGRWSLAIYLVHQPIIVATLSALGIIRLGGI
ncbi:MAG: heparan-alpha-glucosaminide N-acetyltransferase [Rubrobacteraceae bacterium]